MLNKEDGERDLVTLRAISALDPIPNADAIEVATVDGWKVVVKKNEFNVGDTAVYFEIDSFLPESDPRFAFLMKNKCVLDGTRGHRLRTVRLRGQISQGLLLPLREFPELAQASDKMDTILDIRKWERPLPLQLAGQVKGYFPSFIRKTAQERVQNLHTVLEKNRDEAFEITEKLDGTSYTFYRNNDDYGVCSRNLELKLDKNPDHPAVRLFYEAGIKTALDELGENVAFQGELMGPGIQDNRGGFSYHTFHVFDIWSIEDQTYVSPDVRNYLWVDAIYPVVNHTRIFHVPVLHLNRRGIPTLDVMLKEAEGRSMYGERQREGVVYKRWDGKISFKVISNKFLEEEK